jgi:peptidoglycan/xylan/chitin deacetylase (PgdA/CDA1 family)
MKKIIVTTSWDDGHKLDIRLASLLKKYDIKATFYISPKDHEYKKADLLNDDEVKNLAKDFEIGAHTIIHPNLANVSIDQATLEINESKKYLEKLINKKVTSFCYPYGAFKKETKIIVRDAGFLLARTTNEMDTGKTSNKYELPTTIQFTRLSALGIYGQWKMAIRNGNYGLLPYLTSFDWTKNAKHSFDYVLSKGGIYHLWGHSFVIEKEKIWKDLEDLLKYIANRQDVMYVTNSELSEAIK